MAVDVCLVLENTYPYVTGGVSAWVDGLVRGMPDVSFAVAHLREGEGEPGPAAYLPPANLAELVELELDPEREAAEASVAAALPEAGVYHALSTGPAGIVAAGARDERGGAFVLTEHGLAWREARLGIFGCKGPKGGSLPPITGCKGPKGGGSLSITGCKGPKGEGISLPRGMSLEQALRRRAKVVEGMARRSYAEADAIASVCVANARLQRALGAPPERSRTIVNSVAPARERSPSRGPLAAPRIGLVGRVVPIKDVATFLHACALVGEALPGAEFAVVGPLDHEPEYADGCRELALELGLDGRIAFTGETDPADWYRKLDVAVLTSLSEAQPLALLEAMASGLPVVATAVGGCSELVGGTDPAGLLTPVRDPRATAAAILRLCREPELRWRLGRAGLERARGSHSPERMLAAYRALYEQSTAIHR